MKIRSGFVSNSSSSSFVVVLPEKWLDSIDYEKITDGDEDFPLDKFKNLLNELIRRKGMSTDSIYDYDNDYEFLSILEELIDPYIIAEVEHGPDDGKIVIANREKIKKIL